LASNKFYNHIHAFRGFAILNIVAAHCWTILIVVASLNNSHDDFLPLYASSETLFHNATIYFAVVSGLLFSLVLKQYSWKLFFINKLKYVLAPYVFFTVIFAFIKGMVFVQPGLTALTIDEVLKTLPMHLIAGSSFEHMWYIPVLFVLFLLTPFLNFIVVNKRLAPVLVLLVLAPLIVSRSWPDFAWENFVFFFGPYILGMLAGNHYKQTQVLINKYKRGLWLVLFTSTGIMLYTYLIELETIHGVKLQESLGYIQKLSISFLVLHFFKSREKKPSTILDIFGDFSFSIYFVHMFFAAVFGFIMVTIGLTPPTLMGIFLSGFVLLSIGQINATD
jgi:peptidoglycan/LPS O-acetylase OafA/YrhL